MNAYVILLTTDTASLTKYNMYALYLLFKSEK